MTEATAINETPENKHLSAEQPAPHQADAETAHTASHHHAPETPASEPVSADAHVVHVEETTPAGEPIEEETPVADEPTAPQKLVAEAPQTAEETPAAAELSPADEQIAPAEPETVVTAEEPAAEQEPVKKPARGKKAKKAEPEVAPVAAVAAAPAPTDAATETPEDANKSWYVVKVQSGREESIKDSIERRVKIEGLEEYFGEILIPVEKEKVMVRNKRVERERKLYPGYIMAKVEFNDQILYLFRETSGVGDFVGGGPNQKPLPMTAQEVARMKGKPEERKHQAGQSTSASPYSLGERVRVKEGVFSGMEGDIKEVLEAKEQVRVELFVLGRPVSVELDYWQVEPV